MRGPLGWKWQVIDPEIEAADEKKRIDRENRGLYVSAYLRDCTNCILAYGWCKTEDKARKAAEKKATALHKQRSFLNQPIQSITFTALTNDPDVLRGVEAAEQGRLRSFEDVLGEPF